MRIARRASNSPVAHLLARAGLTARGVIYILVGWVAVLVAVGNSSREADHSASSLLGETDMADVAVVAHSRKSFGGGLPELRRILALEGVTDPRWYEVKKSRHAPRYARRAAAKGADVVFVWGGDGTVQRCIDAVAGTDTAVAILPAGTANLLAANLNVPHDLAEAVQVGLHGDRRR